MTKTPSNQKAFTLVEMLAVLAIIGILAAITMGIYGSVKGKAVESRLEAELARIELALQQYKSKNGQFPYSGAWQYQYPPANWAPVQLAPLGNNLYAELVANPLQEGKKVFLPDVSEDMNAAGSLLAPVADVRGGGAYVKWYYNSNNPKYNKDSYDLWVEYGDLGEKPDDPSDDTVKIISNWQN